MQNANVVMSNLKGKKYEAKDILVLLPHCMQNSNCKEDIISDIKNCSGCGGCKVGILAEIVIEKAIKTIVVKGGTAARSMVFKMKPALIVAVACERELKSGINDVMGIPVIGIINDRPYGDCNNTSVNVELFENRLYEILVN